MKKAKISLLLAVTILAGQISFSGIDARATEDVNAVTDGNSESYEETETTDGEGSEEEKPDISEETETDTTSKEYNEVAAEEAAETSQENSDESDQEIEVTDGNSENENDSEADPEVPEGEEPDKDYEYSKDFSYETEIDGFKVSISAKKGVFPDETEVEIKHITGDEAEQIEKKIDEKYEEDCEGATSFDISFFDKAGDELQPKDGSVDVEFELSRDMVIEAEEAGISKIKVIHFEDEGEIEKVDSETEEKGENILDMEDVDIDEYHTEGGEVVVRGAAKNSGIQEHTMKVDFSADSFSIYSLALLADYTHTVVVENGEQVIHLNDVAALTSDFYTYVQQAFNKAYKAGTPDNRCRVILATGRYSLNSNGSGDDGESDSDPKLKLGNNTTFDLNGSVITNGRSKGMIVGTKRKKEGTIAGYKGFENMSVINGTLDANTFNLSGEGFSTIKFGHITGLTISNVNFPNSRGHSIEVAAAKDVKITNCTFEHYSYPGSPNDEAINLDYMHEGWISWGQGGIGPTDDDFPCQNVEIANCTFNDLYRAIGSHNSVVGTFFKNISIHDNVISNITNHAIGCPHYVDSRIYNNTITNVGRGIDSVVEGYAIAESYEYESKAENFTANLEISGNTISMGGATNSGYPYGIRVGGMVTNGSTEIDNGTYYTSGYHISNNTISGFEDGVFIRYAKSSDINNNTASNCKNGYDICNGAEITAFNNNKAYSSWGTGILVREYSRIVSNSGNVVDTAGDDLVSIQGGSSAAIYLDSKYVIGIGETFEPRFYSGESEVTFTSSKKKAVKVSKAGKFKGKKKGTAIITANQDGCTGSVKVVSKKAPKKVKLPKKKSVKKGKTYQIKPKVNSGAGCGKYKFKSDKKKIAKVTATGLVKARKKGKAVITVTAYNGVKSTMVINVK